MTEIEKDGNVFLLLPLLYEKYPKSNFSLFLLFAKDKKKVVFKHPLTILQEKFRLHTLSIYLNLLKFWSKSKFDSVRWLQTNASKLGVAIFLYVSLPPGGRIYRFWVGLSTLHLIRNMHLWWLQFKIIRWRLCQPSLCPLQ